MQGALAGHPVAVSSRKPAAACCSWRGWLLAAGLALAMHLGLLTLLAGEATAPQFRIARDLSVTLLRPVVQHAKAPASEPVERVPTPRPKPEPEKSDPAPAAPVVEPQPVAPPQLADTDLAGDAGEDSPAQQQMAETEPDHNAAFLNNPLPRYPNAARRRGIEGRVVLNVEVLASGICGQIEILQSSGHELLDDAALEAVRHWHFIPASRAGVPVDRWQQIPVSFKLTGFS